MGESQDKELQQAGKLRRQVADCEAALGHLKARLARLEARIAGEPSPETGLDILWQTALPMARQRSSKLQCRQEWNRIPAHERPPVQAAADSLRKWNRCEEWRKDGNAFVPGLHRWIKFRQWENTPNIPDPLARNRATPTPLPPPPDDPATPEEIAEILGVSRKNQPAQSQ